MTNPIPDVARRTKVKQFSISQLHEEALAWLVGEVKKGYPHKKVNASTALEWMIEKCAGDFPKLKKYMELRKELEGGK